MPKLEAKAATRNRRREISLEEALRLGAKFLELPEGESAPETKDALEAMKEKIQKAFPIIMEFSRSGYVAVWQQNPLEVCLFWR